MHRIVPIIMLLVLAGCSHQIKVYSDIDPDYDLWRYTTFRCAQNENIESGKNPLYYNELNDKRVNSAIVEQLKLKGYTAREEKPDVILHYHIVIEDQTVVVPEPYGYSYGPYWTNLQLSYKEGTLIIDLIDANTNRLVWRGWAVSSMDTVYDPHQVEDFIKFAVEKIFRKFPKSARHR